MERSAEEALEAQKLVREQAGEQVREQVAEQERVQRGDPAVASLCALVLRRLQDEIGVAGVTTADQTNVTVADLSAIFGEALEQFSN